MLNILSRMAIKGIVKPSSALPAVARAEKDATNTRSSACLSGSRKKKEKKRNKWK
jgi:hypothetical protein